LSASVRFCLLLCLQMHLLLHLEELQQEVDVRSYDLQGVELETNATRKYLTLKVPRLAESRPSVLRGDALYVSRADGSDGGKEWQGFVHIVRQEEVSISRTICTWLC